ncbi:glycosyltransferase [Psychrobacillus sp. BL-248-WT-3]|uniref:glycosyltransferase n=1 Tax=Psychrobacillus sp. BL-248-WT-3 TaxID=2725306 RepID=UPI00146A4271|nr:glycosyltransferase [Psychrobacillus sp. BL-248-WT-3]NME04468.1 glycosyltransferase family 1 protein [Psychrobacillus sp. BL-248-WT-3]
MWKRILFISEHGDPLETLGGKQAGGQNNYVKELALALGRRGIAVDVITHWSNPSAPQVEKLGNMSRVIRFAAGHKGYIAKDKIYDLLPQFYDEIKNNLSIPKYDVVHSHYWMSGLLGLSLKEEFGIPLVHTSHSLGIAKKQATGTADPIRLAAEKKILTSANKVIATTEVEQQIIQDFAGPLTNIEVISIGVAKEFQSQVKKKSVTKPLLVYAGRLEKTKGIGTLLDAFKKLKKENPELDAKLVLAGGDKEEIDINSGLPINPHLREQVKGIEEYIEFIGPQSQQGLSNLFSKATSVIVPSYYESFGMVAAEAQACGTPVIASGVGGLKDVVSHGKTGLQVKPKDSSQLASAMKTILKDNLLAKRLGREAGERAKRIFNWSSIAKEIDHTYEELLYANDYANASNRS